MIRKWRETADLCHASGSLLEGVGPSIPVLIFPGLHWSGREVRGWQGSEKGVRLAVDNGLLGKATLRNH